MADSINPKAFVQAAARMGDLVYSVQTRQTTRVQGGNIPTPPSTLYRRVDKGADFRPEVSPRAWPSMPPIKNNWVAELRASRQFPWHRRMPWPLRWVMGWP